MFTSRKKITKYIEELIAELQEVKKENSKIREYNKQIADKCEHIMKLYPINIGDTLYEVCLKNDKGRFTKTKPCKEYSSVEELTVDTKNYFKLVEKFNNNEIFFVKKDAQKYLDSLCNN